MKERNVKHENRVKRLIVAVMLCAIILTVSTYAWFIGMKTVNVAAFEINIASTESLALSLDGVTFEDVVKISEKTIKAQGEDPEAKAYANNTNSWGTGLVPVSTIGKINPTSSRLTMYEKGSLTATAGGYRLLASEVPNTGATEAPGYVAFDLFVRNLSGNAYYKEFNPGNEEGIYLVPESYAKTALTGGKENSGIENSVRVAFAQIGRVKVGSTAEEIQGISCKTAGAVTGTCGKDATIYEPNDTKHIQNAINWYNTSCKVRQGASTYGVGSCGTVQDTVARPTYAIAKPIIESNIVDIYDGTEFNGHTSSIENGYLQKQKTFTDTDKDKKGVERPEFMYLAPNSITKVRVYVFIEGQDIDNYDFASLGKKVEIKFGFTKERFYGEDIDYNTSEPTGPALPPEVSARP